MSNIGTAVSNRFRTHDMEGLRQLLAEHFPTVLLNDVTSNRGDDLELGVDQRRVELVAVDGYWPTFAKDADLLRGEFFSFLGDYVVPGELIILHSSAHHSQSEMFFQSVSIDQHGTIRSMGLEDVEALHRLCHAMGR